MNEDWQEECGRYEQMIEELGGIDLQILGLGHNGHIGFNEPDSQFAPDHHRSKSPVRKERATQTGVTMASKPS